MVGLVIHPGTRIDGKKTKARRRDSLDVFRRFQVVSIGTPGSLVADFIQGILSGGHHVRRRAAGARHFPNALLGENRGKIGELADGGIMAGRGEAEAIPEAK